MPENNDRPMRVSGALAGERSGQPAANSPSEEGLLHLKNAAAWLLAAAASDPLLAPYADAATLLASNVAKHIEESRPPRVVEVRPGVVRLFWP